MLADLSVFISLDFISVVLHYVLCFKMLSLYLVVKFKLFLTNLISVQEHDEIITLQNKLY